MSVQGQRRGFPGFPGGGVFFLACAALLALSACQTLPQQIAMPSANELDWVQSGADRLQGAAPPGQVEDLDALLRVTPEMHRFVEAAIGGGSAVSGQIEALMKALDGLHLRYDSTATLTAAQAFAQRRVNCLSYALLYAALALDAGVVVQFNDVEIPPIWDLGNARTALLYRHLNLRVRLNQHLDASDPPYEVLDVSGEYDPRFPQHPISDAEAEAQFYNNRAMELLMQDRGDEALRNELRALELAPDAPYLWANLSGVYLHWHALRAARIAADRALMLDPSALLSYEIAAEVYAELGQKELAASLHRRAEDFLEQNPYYHYQLALEALDRHDEPLAYRQVALAIARRPDEPRFLFLQAVLASRRGEAGQAENDMREVMEMTQDTAQQERYRDKFVRLKEQARQASKG